MGYIDTSLSFTFIIILSFRETKESLGHQAQTQAVKPASALKDLVVFVESEDLLVKEVAEETRVRQEVVDSQ